MQLALALEPRRSRAESTRYQLQTVPVATLAMLPMSHVNKHSCLSQRCVVGCPGVEVFGQEWMPDKDLGNSLTPATVVRMICRLMQHQPSLEMRLAKKESYSSASWTAAQNAACKALFALHWLGQHPKACQQLGKLSSHGLDRPETSGMVERMP